MKKKDLEFFKGYLTDRLEELLHFNRGVARQPRQLTDNRKSARLQCGTPRLERVREANVVGRAL